MNDELLIGELKKNQGLQDIVGRLTKHVTIGTRGDSCCGECSYDMYIEKRLESLGWDRYYAAHRNETELRELKFSELKKLIHIIDKEIKLGPCKVTGLYSVMWCAAYLKLNEDNVSNLRDIDVWDDAGNYRNGDVNIIKRRRELIIGITKCPTWRKQDSQQIRKRWLSNGMCGSCGGKMKKKLFSSMKQCEWRWCNWRAGDPLPNEDAINYDEIYD